MRIHPALLIVLIGACVTGCGVAETGAAAAAGGASRAEEVRQGQETQERVRRQLDEAARQAARQRADAEAAIDQ